ncbi:MAG: hypothetical protein AMS19_01910 [Gemmatimonas sp. SG8_23]|nr:MAG: hypothetical protein AMS19_01910 [Gemmatimonas sp. SG8_23]
MKLTNTPLALLGSSFALLLLGAGPAPQELENDEWPKAIELANARIVIYQPELESFEGNDLSGRAAVSVTAEQTGGEPVFGVVWIDARVETDRDARTVTVLDIEVPTVRFPNSEPEDEEALAAILEEQVPAWHLTFSLDRLLTGLDLLEQQREEAERFSGLPPTIVVRSTPTVLVSIDGDPILEGIDGTDVMAVVNTPFTMLLASGRYYLFAEEGQWYAADAIDGSWDRVNSVPAEVQRLAPEPPEDLLEADEAAPADEEGPPPAILVATEPTELIVTDGEPRYTPIEGTDLLYVTNSESDILMDIGSQRHFVVLSGRWYASLTTDGPWLHVPPDELPATMADIPPTSDMAHLLISVPGTEASKEAILDHQIPQTAAIRRDQASLEVEYDGEPWFEEIYGTSLEYAINTDAQVIKAGPMYYAVSEGVWFESGSPEGPWRVADEVPDEIYDIPPDVPVHNVKYVHIYESTPTVVYVGYYPGYTYSYVYGGTIVYGTGYWYRPWYGTVYYPRPATWGFHVRYNPWYGWSYGFSYSTGPFTFAMGWGSPYYRPYPGWWGPMGYRGYAAGYHRGWHAGYRAGARAGYRAGYRAGTRAANARNNIYDRPANRPRNAARPATADRVRPDRAAPSTRNNIYAGPDGNVYRRGENGWESRDRQGGWTPSDRARPSDPSRPQTRPETRPTQPGARPTQPGAPPTQPSTRPSQPSARPGQPSTRPAPTGPSLDRSYQSRSRGNARAQDFQRTRPAPRAGRPRGRGR